jgi:transposase
VIDGILWQFRTGCSWRDIPFAYCPRTTLFNRFTRWGKAGVWQRIRWRYRDGGRLYRSGAPAWRAPRNGGAVGRSRGGLTTRIHALVDADGKPVRLILTPGQAGDAPVAPGLSANLRAGATLIADRSYDTDAIRALATERGARVNIPPRGIGKHSFALSPRVYRQRNRVERHFNRIKNFRGTAIRDDKTGANYLAGVTRAAIRVWLKSYKSTA